MSAAHHRDRSVASDLLIYLRMSPELVWLSMSCVTPRMVLSWVELEVELKPGDVLCGPVTCFPVWCHRPAGDMLDPCSDPAGFKVYKYRSSWLVCIYSRHCGSGLGSASHIVYFFGTRQSLGLLCRSWSWYNDLGGRLGVICRQGL